MESLSKSGGAGSDEVVVLQFDAEAVFVVHFEPEVLLFFK